ncbi:MAG: hypothetical protein RIF41_11255 [Polyangiaceae bacterium]
MPDLAEAFRALVVEAVTEAVGADARGELVQLSEGFGPVKGSTLMAWARSGRLRAFRADRGRFVAWERDVREAVEADPVVPVAPSSGVRAAVDGDDLDGLLSDDTIEMGGSR